MPEIVEEREFPYAVVVNAEGQVIFNAFQADDVVIRRKYDDRMIDLRVKSTGEILMDRYDPETMRARCPKCGHQW